MNLSKRMSTISESVTLKLNALVESMKADGVPIINLTAGEPDFGAPEEAKKAIIKAVEQGKNKYAPVAGVNELRSCVAQKTNLQQPSISSPWTAANVLITNGAKQALYNTFLSIMNETDEVLIPEPYWLSYPEMVKIAGGCPKAIETRPQDGFKLTPDVLRRSVSSWTKAIVLNSPSNPTGAVYSRDEYRALADVLLQKPFENVWIISDEIYDRIEYTDGQFSSFLGAAPELQNRVVTINGMSKVFAMTGWRVGWIVANSELIKATAKLQGQSTSGVNSLAQWASIAALDAKTSTFPEQLEKYKSRRAIALDILQECGKIEVVEPMGAFYVFVGLKNLLSRYESAIEWSEHLLKEKGVAVVPGNAFGRSDYVRISFATDEKSIEEGCKKFVQFAEESLTI